jgi:hypothetical protein
MANDDTPTPRQTDSFYIMSQSCVDTIDAFDRWRATKAMPGHVSQRIVELTRETKGLLDAVSRWPTEPPDPDRKRGQIARILGIREEAADIAKIYGHDLFGKPAKK